MLDLIVGDILNLLLKTAAIALLAYGGMRWGWFAAREAERMGPSRWKAYLLGVLVPATLGYVVFCEPTIASWGYPIAAVSSAGSVFGVLVRYPRSVE